MANRKILIVDDTTAELVNLKTIVSAADCTVVTATSGKEAVAKAKSEKPGLIFMDIVMSDMDGYNACRDILNDPETKDIPIVFVSSKHQKADRIWAQKQGGRALITKPYTPEQILEQIKAYC